MSRSEFAQLLSHLDALVTEQHWDALYLHTRRALSLAQSAWQAGRVLRLCLQVPAAQRHTRDWALLTAYAAFRSGDAACCAAHLPGGAPEGDPLRAWVLLCEDRAEEALAVSEGSLSGGAGDLAGVAWRMRAWAMACLRKPGWEEAFREAATHNTGRQRGIALLQLGGFLSYAGQDREARSAYAEAAPALTHDPELRAIAHYNVGTACLRLNDPPAAERAYQDAMRWASKPEGSAVLARAWSGLGHVYRASNELPRALHAYAVSQTKATELDDVYQAWRGQAHTLRLSGRHDEALWTAQEALERLGTPERHALYADLAAIQLGIRDDAGARLSLQRVDEGQEEERQRALIVRAELARRADDLPEARRLLADLTPGALWVREEARLLPELFALLGYQAAAPAPLRLRVQADGPLRAFLNGRPLALRPLAPSASLLALLVWRGGSVAVHSALDLLTLAGQDARRRRQNLSRAVGELRESLGWPGAVQSDSGALRLDPCLSWEALGLPERPEDFCAGLEDPWIEHWREEHDPANQLIKL